MNMTVTVIMNAGGKVYEGIKMIVVEDPEPGWAQPGRVVLYKEIDDQDPAHVFDAPSIVSVSARLNK